MFQMCFIRFFSFFHSWCGAVAPLPLLTRLCLPESGADCPAGLAFCLQKNSSCPASVPLQGRASPRLPGKTTPAPPGHTTDSMGHRKPPVFPDKNPVFQRENAVNKFLPSLSCAVKKGAFSAPNSNKPQTTYITYRVYIFIARAPYFCNTNCQFVHNMPPTHSEKPPLLKRAGAFRGLIQRSDEPKASVPWLLFVAFLKVFRHIKFKHSIRIAAFFHIYFDRIGNVFKSA